MHIFLSHGDRIIAIERRGYGSFEQVSEGHNMDYYAADADADADEVVKSLDLENVIHIGNSTGGGQVAS